MQSVESAKNNATARAGVGQWIESTMGILYVVDGSVQFADDFDHFRNAFCRLLEIPEEKAKRYIEEAVQIARKRFSKLLSELSDEQRCQCLIDATDKVLYGGTRPGGGEMKKSWGGDFQGAAPNKIYAHSVSGDRSRLVVGNTDHKFAWLIDAATNLPVRADSINYDGAYFGGSEGNAHYGMKHYVAQSDWRLEKARRLVKTVLDCSGPKGDAWRKDPSSATVLDVGAGLGYFRKAFDELGFKHFGVDVSSYINAQCKQMFGFDTWECDFAKLDEVSQGRKFDIIAMWELIEHVEDAAEAIKIVQQYLKPGGIIVARTPNLDALEYDVLGDYYYSFKFEHVKYFSPLSYDHLMNSCGLKKVYLETSSHIFKGLLSADYLYKVGQSLRGADILAIYSS